MAVFSIYTFTSFPPSYSSSYFHDFTGDLLSRAWIGRRRRRSKSKSKSKSKATTRLFVLSSHSNPKILKSNRRSRYGQTLSPYDSNHDAGGDGFEYDDDWDEDDWLSDDEFAETKASDIQRFKSWNPANKSQGSHRHSKKEWGVGSIKEGQTKPNNIGSLGADGRGKLEVGSSTKNRFCRLSEELDLDEKWFPLLDYLSTFGLKESHFIQMYERHMPSLQINVGSAQERLEFLLSVGVKHGDMRKILLRQPQILEYTVENNMKSHVAFLVSLGIPDSRMGQIITATPSLFSYSVENSLKPTVRYLVEEVGIKKSDLSKVVQLSPQILVQRIDSSWTTRFSFLTKELGAPRDNIVKMVRKHPQLLHYSIEDGLLPRINFLRSIGMRNSDILKVLTSLTQMKENPRELNPYFKNNGTGYPEEADGTKAGRNQLLSSAVVGDGGASWRLKALKRAQEQAAREGMALEEVVGERWGSLGQLAVSVASRTAAPSRAHLRAIKNRKKGLSEEQQTTVDDRNEKVTEKNIGRERLRDRRHSEMKVPKHHDSLSWGKRKSQSMSSNKDSDLISTAMASLNKFANDGNFMSEVICQQNDDRGGSPCNCERNVESEMVSFESQKPGESSAVVNQGMSANQLAAKALQLCLKGKHEEAEKLLKEVENIKAKQGTVDESSEAQNERNKRRYGTRDTSIQQRKKEDDADMHLAQKIAQNKQYSISGRADDEYDFDDGPRRKTRKKGAKDNMLTEKTNFPQRILTQQERCQFCFENPSRPRHLVVAIANFTYLSLPHWQSIVPGHCCILTSQHESATRAVDNNVWDEIRNFKKCLIMMFAKQGKDVVFLETVMGLAQQRRHCMVECIPLPQDIAKQAPLYFKKAIDEAEDEWSQHNSKKLIDTSEKGLRGSIPKDFPYFHVEFGLNKGFVHVMDDEKQFKSNFELNVIRGMLRLPEEDMYGRRKHDSVEIQKQAVARFVKHWEPFDWTKQLD